MEKIKLIRHLEESKAASQVRDDHIDEKEIGLLKEVYVPNILEFLNRKEFKKISLIMSNALRSKETAELLKNELAVNNVSVPIGCEVDKRTSALSHGKYREGIHMDHPLVKKAKYIYLDEVFNKNNPWYRFGSSFSGNEKSYPELERAFEELGENQAELNIRIYRFVLDILDRIKKENDECIILSTHYVVMSRLLALEKIGQTKEGFHLFYFPNGDLYMHEWDISQELMSGNDFHDFFKINNFIFDIDMNQIEKIKGAIQSDLDLYLIGYMQRYGKEI